LEECLETIPRGMHQMRLKLRASAIKNMRHSGIGVQDVARAFGVSTRTVQREMKRIRRIKK
jgi:IS30 family transposase